MARTPKKKAAHHIKSPSSLHWSAAMTEGEKSKIMLPIWEDIKSKKSVVDSSSSNGVGHPQLPADVKSNIEEILRNMLSLREAAISLSLVMDKGSCCIPAIVQASDRLSEKANRYSHKPTDILRQAYVDAAAHEDLKRFLVLADGRDDPLLGAEFASLETHHLVEAVKRRAVDLRSKVRDASRYFAIVNGINSENEVSSLDSEIAGLEQIKQELEIDLERLLLHRADQSFIQSSCEIYGEGGSTLAFGSKDFAESPCKSVKSASNWKKSANALRTRRRPRVSLSQFEKDESSKDVVDVCNIASSHVKVSQKSASQMNSSTPSVFSSVSQAIEKYDVVRVKKVEVVHPSPKSLPSSQSAKSLESTSLNFGDEQPRRRRSEDESDRPPLPTKDVSTKEGRPRSNSRSRSLSGDLGPELQTTVGRKNSMRGEEDTTVSTEPRPRSNTKSRLDEVQTISAPIASPFAQSGASGILTSSASSLQVGSSSGAPNYAKRVEEIYQRHNPSKLSEIPSLLQKYAGREQELVEKLEKKYVTPAEKPSIIGSTQSAGSLTPSNGFNQGNPFQATTPASNSLLSPAPKTSLFASPIQQSAATPFGTGATSASQPQPQAQTPFQLSSGFGVASSNFQSQPSFSTPTQPSPFGAPSQTSSFSSPSNSLQDIAQRVHQIYQQHNPAKIAEIPSLLEKYKGKELQLIANLEKKYNCSSSGASNHQLATPITPGFGSPGTGLMGVSPMQSMASQPAQGATPFGSGAHSLFGNRAAAQPASPAWGQTQQTSSPWNNNQTIPNSLFGSKPTNVGGWVR